MAVLDAAAAWNQPIDSFEIIGRFRTAAGMSRFLFPLQVQVRLRQVLKAVEHLASLKTIPWSRYTELQQQILREEKKALHDWIIERRKTLPDLFANEMGLGGRDSIEVPEMGALPPETGSDEHPRSAEYRKDRMEDSDWYKSRYGVPNTR